MTKQFKAGQQIKCVDASANAAAFLVEGRTYTVSGIVAGFVHLVGRDDEGWAARRFEPVQAPRRKFKAGDTVRANSKSLDITEGKEYTVTYDEQEDGFLLIRDDDGDENGLLYAREFTLVRAVAETPRDFRIRKHGARGEIRGTSYASKEEAREAAARYVDGVYETVRVTVEDTIKVERVSRVVDFKEAA